MAEKREERGLRGQGEARGRETGKAEKGEVRELRG